MKTKTKKMMLSIAMMFLCSFASKAFTFTNNLTNCSVTITYEMRGSVGGGCLVCNFATITIPPGQFVTVTNCPGMTGVCVDISDIGGSAPAANHVSTTVCHVVTAYGQSGTLAGCNASGTWTAIAGASNWVIS